MIIDYDRRPNATEQDRLQSLIASVMMALNEKADRSVNGGVEGALTINSIYPVGSIYMSVTDVNPASLFKGTKWEQIKDRFLLAAGSTYSIASTGGEAAVTLTSAQSGLPAHRHSATTNDSIQQYFVTNDNSGASNAGFTTSSSGKWTDGQATSGTFHHMLNTGSVSAENASQAHNNMPPYLAVNVWKRTA